MQTITKQKTKPTRISLAYCPNSNQAILFNPGDEAIQKFQNMFGLIYSVGSCDRRYPGSRKNIGIFWLVHFIRATLWHGVHPQALHKVLLKIPEYKKLLEAERVSAAMTE